MNNAIFLLGTLLYILMYSSVFKCNKQEIINKIIYTYICGIAMSFFLSIMNFSIHISWHVIILLPITILVSYINSKYTCIAYAFPIYYVIYKIIELKGILDVPGFVCIIAISHILEGILIIIDEIVTKDKDNKIDYEVIDMNKYFVIAIYKNFWFVPIHISICTSADSNLSKILLYAPCIFFLIITYVKIINIDKIDCLDIANKENGVRVFILGSIYFILYFIVSAVKYMNYSNIIEMIIVLFIPCLHEQIRKISLIK